MVTYCFYAVFAALASFNLFQGRPWVALFYAVLLGIMIWFDRKMARDSKAFAARMAESAAKHKALMAKLEADAKRWKAEADEDHRRILVEIGKREAARQRYLDENYFLSIVVHKSDVTPLDERKEALVRQEFQAACEFFLTSIRG